MIKQVLTIAGSDSGGGAGIQADLKTFSALGTYGMSVITAITAQNTTGVTGIEVLCPSIVKSQMEAIFTDMPVDAVKIGMVANDELIEVIAETLRRFQLKHVVVDPVMVSTTGSILLEKRAIDAMKQHLLPLATLITPNLHEAGVLLDQHPSSMKELLPVAVQLKTFTQGEVLVKGGHQSGDIATDVLSSGETFSAQRIDTEHTHGTGCSLSSAIAAFLAQEFSLVESVKAAKQFVTEGLRQAYPVGSGSSPIHHFHAYWNHQ